MSRNARMGTAARRWEKLEASARGSVFHPGAQADHPRRPLGRQHRAQKSISDYEESQVPPTDPSGPPVVPQPPQPLSVMSSRDSSPEREERRERRRHQLRQEPVKAKDDRFYPLWNRFSRKPPAPKLRISASLDVDIEEADGHHIAFNRSGEVVRSESATVSFNEARETCRNKVKAIVAECQRMNTKYFDRTFDLRNPDSLMSIDPEELPGSVRLPVRRVEDIFERPEFVKDRATPQDVMQGKTGDCWFLAAVTALSATEGDQDSLNLLSRLFVARDEKVGVYGFVFYRDGEWISEVVDDRLVVKFVYEDTQHFHYRVPWEKDCFDPIVQRDDRNFRRLNQDEAERLSKGSDMLYFASCHDSNETWLPLLEKAYAKAHGDYQAIEAGWAGEGIVDLTGGVTRTFESEDVLDKDVLWSELRQVNKTFLFGCASRNTSRESDMVVDKQYGIIRGHAYTVIEAVEFQGQRLIKLRNPWGKTEWNGAWSDGSKEWTPEAMKELKHKFGDDGLFWISYKDFLSHYPELDRTRLFDETWMVYQQWTSLNVHYTPGYQDQRFKLTVKEDGDLVLVLAKPDDRYFRGLQGRFRFLLHFRVYREGEPTYLLRSVLETGGERSVSAELPDAKAGTYYVIMKITAYREEDLRAGPKGRPDAYPTAQEQMRKFMRSKREKLLEVGKSFDRVHSKGRLQEREIKNEETKRTKARQAWIKKQANVLKERRLVELEIRQKERKKHLRWRGVSDGRRDARDEARARRQPLRRQDTLQDEELAAASPMSSATDLPADRKDSGRRRRFAEESFEDSDHVEDLGEALEGLDMELHWEATDCEMPWDSDLDDPVPRAGAFAPDESDSEDDVFADDAWNAVCVVGLRVYTRDANASIEVTHG